MTLLQILTTGMDTVALMGMLFNLGGSLLLTRDCSRIGGRNRSTLAGRLSSSNQTCEQNTLHIPLSLWVAATH